MGTEKSVPEFLRDLAERLMHVPIMYGTDQDDISRLQEIARRLEEIESELEAAALGTGGD